MAFDYINTHGKDLHGEPLGKYFIHGLGHHVGLNVHDANDPAMALDKAWFSRLSPVFTFLKKSCVRIEDLFAVGQDGKLIMLSQACPAPLMKSRKQWRSKLLSGFAQNLKTHHR